MTLEGRASKEEGDRIQDGPDSVPERVFEAGAVGGLSKHRSCNFLYSDKAQEERHARIEPCAVIEKMEPWGIVVMTWVRENPKCEIERLPGISRMLKRE